MVHSRKRSAFTFLASCAAALFLVTGLTVTPAQAADGSIQGTVTFPDNAGEKQYQINLYQLVDGQWQIDGFYDWKSTPQYTLGSLEPGTYRLHFNTVVESWTSTFYGNAATVEEATDVVVTSGEAAMGIDHAVGFSGKITGTITNADPPESTDISAFRQVQGEWKYFSGWWGGQSGHDGSFTLVHLTPGTYRLRFEDADQPKAYGHVFYVDSDTVAGATDINVTGGQTTSGIDIELPLKEPEVEPPTPTGPGTLDQKQTSTESDPPLPNFTPYAFQVSGSGTNEGEQVIAQTVTAGLSGTLDQIDLRMADYSGQDGANPRQPLTVEIRDVASGKPGSTVLASTTVPPADLPECGNPDCFGDWVSIDFASPATVTEGTPYAIVASVNDPLDMWGWQFVMRPEPDDPYPGGKLLGRFGQGDWVFADDGSFLLDMTFQTWVTTPQEPGELEEEVTGGETVTTDHDGTGPTEEVPVQTEIVVPDNTAGTITVQPEPVGSPPSGFSFFDHQVDLSGPDAPSAADPYVVAFALDASLVGSTAPGDVQVFRDGVPVADCAHASDAVPDPCVADRSAGAGGDALITVRTTQFSDWNFGPTPDPGRLTVECPDTETTPGVSVECSVFVSTGTPVPTGTVSLAASTFKGTLSRRSCPVASSSDPCEFTYTPKGNGSATRTDKITVTYSGGSSYPKQVKTLSIAVKPKPIPLLGAECGDQTTPGVPVQCAVFVDPNGAGQPTGSVALAASSLKGTLSRKSCPATASTDPCEFTYTPKRTGSPTRVDNIRATYPGDARYQNVSIVEGVNVSAP
jgi:hypothetical protein